jgi:hypothetical protein
MIRPKSCAGKQVFVHELELMFRTKLPALGPTSSAPTSVTTNSGCADPQAEMAALAEMSEVKMFPKSRPLSERQMIRAAQAGHLARIAKEQKPIEQTVEPPAWTAEQLSALKNRHWIDGRAQNATQRFFGDPLPGRSALDQREGR